MQIETRVEIKKPGSKKGGSIPCIARAKVIDEGDGYVSFDDLSIFWRPKKENGKLYPIKESLIANTEKAEEDLSVAYHSQKMDRDY